MIDESIYIAKGPIYKFTSAEWAKVILETNTLKFTNPSDFNDPFDCNMAILKFSKTEESIAEYKAVLDSFNISRRKKRELSNKFKSDPKEFRRVYTDVVKQKIANSGVTCFSRLYDNTLMWSHYGDQHKGVCLEFNASLNYREIFEDVEVGMIANVNYDRTDKINYNTDKRHAVLDLFMRKSTDWKYEEETRIVLVGKKDILKFNRKFLTGVIFGCKIDKKEKESIMKIIEEMKYDVTIKEAKKGDFKLEYKKIM